MLVEIRCDKFLDEGKVREPITFHAGLNTVMGASRASNSIGKTTFLLIIDFVFGGRDYVTLNTDVVKNVGEHTILFKFEFNGQPYYFQRSTAEPGYVAECDDQYNPKSESKMSLETYCNFLSRMYGMDGLNATFRDLVSGYFRIYGRYNYDERHPLRAHGNDTMEAGIRRLLQLYGKYGAIGELTELYEKASEEEITHKNAYKYQYIRGCTRQDEYEKNEKRIKELQEKKENLALQSSQGLLDMDSVQATRLIELKGKLAGFRRQKGRLRSKLRAMENDMNIDAASFKRDYSELLEFFPGADIKHIEEIDSFHKQLKSVLNSEYKDAQKKINQSIEMLDIEISMIEQEITEIDAEPHLTKAVLDDYASIDREMKNLSDANAYYGRHKELHDAASILGEQLNKLISETTADLQTEINIGLYKLNQKVCEPNVSAPKFVIKDAKSYSYTIANDTGTGSQTRGMLLYDIQSLKMTALPALIEDSMGLKQIEDAVILKYLHLSTIHLRNRGSRFLLPLIRGNLIRKRKIKCLKY